MTTIDRGAWLGQRRGHRTQTASGSVRARPHWVRDHPRRATAEDRARPRTTPSRNPSLGEGSSDSRPTRTTSASWPTGPSRPAHTSRPTPTASRRRSARKRSSAMRSRIRNRPSTVSGCGPRIRFRSDGERCSRPSGTRVVATRLFLRRVCLQGHATSGTVFRLANE